MKIIKFLKDWTLIIAIIVGIAAYFIYTAIPVLDSTHKVALRAVEIIQPMLIFLMLFITFCRVNPRKLRLCKWHWWLLLFQCGMFTLISCILILMPQSGLRVVLEGAMICLICPTATYNHLYHINQYRQCYLDSLACSVHSSQSGFGHRKFCSVDSW